MLTLRQTHYGDRQSLQAQNAQSRVNAEFTRISAMPDTLDREVQSGNLIYGILCGHYLPKKEVECPK